MLKYFADEELQKPLSSVDFDRTVQGQSKKITVYVFNTSAEQNIELDQPVTTDKDLRILEYPRQLLPSGSGKVVLEFSPPLDRISPLRAGWDFRKTIF